MCLYFRNISSHFWCRLLSQKTCSI